MSVRTPNSFLVVFNMMHGRLCSFNLFAAQAADMVPTCMVFKKASRSSVYDSSAQDSRTGTCQGSTMVMGT